MGGRIIKSGREKFIDGQRIRKDVIMTRKRFIKQAMSYGIQRNEANEWAADIRNYQTYRCLLHICKLPNRRGRLDLLRLIRGDKHSTLR